MKVNKIIIIEPSPIVTAGLLDFFKDINQIRIVSTLENIDDISNKIIIHDPDILIINPLVLGYNSNYIKQISQSYPNIIFIALVTSYIDRSILRQYKEVIELSDNKHKVVNKVIGLLSNKDETNNQGESIELSNRERDILIHVAKGMTNKDISEILNISVHTVITHRKNIIRKTGIKSVSGLTVYALLNNLIEEWRYTNRQSSIQTPR